MIAGALIMLVIVNCHVLGIVLVSRWTDLILHFGLQGSFTVRFEENIP